MKTELDTQVAPLVEALKKTNLFTGVSGWSDARVSADPSSPYANTQIEFLIEKVVCDVKGVGHAVYSVTKRYIPRVEDGPIEFLYEFEFRAFDETMRIDLQENAITELVKWVAESVTSNWNRFIKRDV
jgi:hypothetical protein